MTGADLVGTGGLVRLLAHDTASGASTDARYYQPNEIINAVVRARQDTIDALFAMGDLRPSATLLQWLGKLGMSYPVKRARITLSGLLRSVAFSAPNQTIPNDLWRLECGVENDGSYIIALPAVEGELLSGTWQHNVYTLGGTFQGTFGTIYYYANCTTVIADDGTDLNAGQTPMNDQFYETVALKALTYLFQKEQASKANRIAIVQGLWKESIFRLK